MPKNNSSYYAVRGAEQGREYYSERREKDAEKERSETRRTTRTDSGSDREKVHKQRRMSPPRAEYIARGFDDNDRAPEDRFTGQQCRAPQRSGVADMFDTYDNVVRGTFHIEGVNYSKYEACKDIPERSNGFTDAVKDDIISEVGNGVRREDIKLRIYPGAIKTVVLHYDEEGTKQDPRLVDAEWNLKVDYGIRARDAQRQQNIAMALFSAFTSSYGFSDGKTKFAYKRTIDRHVADVQKIRITRLPPEEGEQNGQRVIGMGGMGGMSGGGLGQGQVGQVLPQQQPGFRPAVSPPRPQARLHAMPIPAPQQPNAGYAPAQPAALVQTAERSVFDSPSGQVPVLPRHPTLQQSVQLPHPGTPQNATSFDAQRDAELARLTDDIYRFVHFIDLIYSESCFKRRNSITGYGRVIIPLSGGYVQSTKQLYRSYYSPRFPPLPFDNPAENRKYSKQLKHFLSNIQSFKIHLINIRFPIVDSYSKKKQSIVQHIFPIHRERLKLRGQGSGGNLPPNVMNSLSPVAPERPYPTAYPSTAMKPARGRHPSGSEYSMAETHFVTTEF